MQTPREHARTLPDRPGVYRFLDGNGRVLYVGKAKNLKKRVANYFQKTRSLEPSKRQMVKRAAALDTTVTASENEALLLEATLIKQHHPPYNIILRDDKDFLYIKVTVGDEFPTVLAIRRPVAEKARYFGPFTSARDARGTVRFLKRTFAFRTCTAHQGRACFDVHLHRCLGPCDDRITAVEYKARVTEPILRFLSGETKLLEKTLAARMRTAAKNRNYELAAQLRDQLRAIGAVADRQSVISARAERFDALGFHRFGALAAVTILQIRAGKLLGKRDVLLEQQSEARDRDIVSSFLEQYYAVAADRPPEIALPFPVPSMGSLGRLLKTKLGVPSRGRRKRLVATATTNAREYLERRTNELLSESNRARRALEGLTTALGLAATPKRIECFDISNNQGAHAVGSMVVFEHGLPKKSDYRKFSIRRSGTPDDFHMMAEMVMRRLKHPEWPRPDLVILDGGKGQLSVVLAAIGKQLKSTTIVALAKQEEEFFLPGAKVSVRLPASSDALFLVQRIRDEAHRFAITFYRGKHRKALTASRFDELPGLGPKTKKLLKKTFGTWTAVKNAPETELIKLLGAKKARTLLELL